MKKRWIVLGMLAVLMIGGLGGTVLGVAGTTVVAARTFGDSENGLLSRLIVGQIGRLLTLRSELNLTADQRQQIRDIVQSHRPEIAAVVKPLVEKRRALRTATNSSPVDETAIRAASADLAQSIGDAAMLAAKIKLEVRKVMTPQQAQQIDAFRQQSDAEVDDFVQELSKP
jgi:Spy/CpxP family protein refolding chaperone